MKPNKMPLNGIKENEALSEMKYDEGTKERQMNSV